MAYRDIKAINETQKIGQITKAFEDIRSGKDSQNSRFSQFSKQRDNKFSQFKH